MIRGGWDRGRGDRGSFGVSLSLGLPDDLPDALAIDLGDARGTLPAGGVALYSGTGVTVDAVDDPTPHMDRMTHGPHSHGVRGSAWVELVAEATEGSRASHITVLLGERPVGRMARKNLADVSMDVRAYHRVLRDYADAGRRAYCRVDVHGGGVNVDGSRRPYRFTLRLDTAQRQADLLAAGGRKGKRTKDAGAPTVATTPPRSQGPPGP